MNSFFFFIISFRSYKSLSSIRQLSYNHNNKKILKLKKFVIFILFYIYRYLTFSFSGNNNNNNSSNSMVYIKDELCFILKLFGNDEFFFFYTFVENRYFTIDVLSFLSLPLYFVSLIYLKIDPFIYKFK